jgi:hypothetical protein
MIHLAALTDSDNLGRGSEVVAPSFIPQAPRKNKGRAFPEYAAWSGMKRRCYNPKSPKYKYYGGRGIVVCDRWLQNYDAFYFDMGPRPEGHSIDRIDNDGPYSPENCRWATPTQQNNNQRHKPSKFSGFVGVFWTKNQKAWTAQGKLNGKPVTLYCGKCFGMAVRKRLSFQLMKMEAIKNGEVPCSPSPLT